MDASAPLKSFESYMIDVVMSLSQKCGISPFEILKQDFDDFAFIVNHFLEHQGEEKPATKGPPKGKKEKRIKVNDRTASGGWF